MKRIGIITLYKDNYGSELQCYATKHYLESLGYRCDVLDERFIGIDKLLHKLDGWRDTVWKTIRYRGFWANRKEMKIASALANSSLSEASQRELDYFAYTVLQPRFIDHKVLYDETFRSEYSFFICGSDQVWNGANRISELRFLDFASDKQKVALSPSFGVSDVKNYNIPEFRKKISRFRFLSAREDSGVRIIKELTGKTVQRLPDPIVILSPDEWERFSAISIKLEYKYLLMHFLDDVSDETIASVNDFATANNLKVVCFAYPRKNYEKLVNWVFLDGGPRDYVGLIRNADFICTDSFHTSYFSIVFGKQFLTFSRNYQHKNSQSARIESLLKRYNAEDRYVDRTLHIIISGDYDVSKFGLVLKTEQAAIREYLGVILEAYEEVESHTTPDLKTHQDCVGCMACTDICPQNAVTIQYSDFGHRMPYIDEKKCVLCGMCEKVCRGKIHRNASNPSALIAFNTEKKLQLSSASGGVFSALAKEFLSCGGAVVGAELRFENGKPVCNHIVISHADELNRVISSKYVESDMTGIYRAIEKMLKDGKAVLFGGTSCQVNALYNYLELKKVSVEHLFTVDLICHGVPGIKLFSDYIEQLEEKYHSEVAAFAFRKKENNSIYFEEQIIFAEQMHPVEKIPMSESCYYRLFMHCESYRNQCYHCDYARIDKPADITIGDYFEAREDYPEFFIYSDSEMSLNHVNAVIVHNQKGKRLIEQYGSGLAVRSVDIRKVQLSHGQLCAPSAYSYFRIKAKKAYVTGGIKRLEKAVLIDKKKRKCIDQLKSVFRLHT